MKILTNYNQLVGKTISFSHMAQFADQITLATTDGEVLMATLEYDDDEDDIQIRVLNEYTVIGIIQKHSYLQKELNKLGIFDLEEWKREQEKRRKEEQEKYRQKKEQQEREMYEKLKVKFESQ